MLVSFGLIRASSSKRAKKFISRIVTPVGLLALGTRRRVTIVIVVCADDSMTHKNYSNCH